MSYSVVNKKREWVYNWDLRIYYDDHAFSFLWRPHILIRWLVLNWYTLPNGYMDLLFLCVHQLVPIGMPINCRKNTSLRKKTMTGFSMQCSSVSSQRFECNTKRKIFIGLSFKGEQKSCILKHVFFKYHGTNNCAYYTCFIYCWK